MKYIKQMNLNEIYTVTNQTFRLRFGLISVCLTLLFSCESFVDVDLPNNQINGETVFEDTGTATAALADIYTQLRDNVLVNGRLTSGITTLFGHYSDELDLYNQGLISVGSFYNNTLVSSSGTVSEMWGSGYKLIYATNSIIQGLNNSKVIPQDEKDQLMGEALFARAFVHFYLVNLFGDIPYIEITDYQENTQASKIPVVEVYEKIVLDLLEAKTLLSDSYISGERTRPNRGVASALLSRVYLYTEDWENARIESTMLINNTDVYAWNTDLGTVFLKESRSILWQFKPNASGDNTRAGTSFVFAAGPPPNWALTTSLIDAFEPGDDRFTNWVGSATDMAMTDTWYYPFKYKESAPTSSSLEYDILFRLAEQYLIRAEARAQLEDIIGAQTDLNIIRNRAGLNNTTASSTNDLLNAILQERRVELFTEFGHRFFDLKRTEMLDVVLGPIKQGWESTDVLLPIPETELLVNSNLKPQNPGY